MISRAGAIFSDDKQYRYVLWRQWNSRLPVVMYIGLNPSTANAEHNDATISKLIKITRNNGFGGFYMTNLFGVISPKPEVLLTHPNPIGDNDEYLMRVSRKVKAILFCWGSFKEAYKSGREAQVRALFVDMPASSIGCLKKSKAGNPWHPLYCLDNQKFIQFSTLK